MAQYELNLMDYWLIISRRRITVFVIAFTVFLGTILYTLSIKSEYQATATLMITEQKTMSTVLMELSGTPLGDPLVSYARSITSLPIIEGAVKQLGLAGKNATPEEITDVAGSLQGAVGTSIQENTNLIDIIVTHHEPELTAKLANKIVEVFIAQDLKDKSKQSRKVREFIEGQLVDLGKKLADSENKLRDFREKETPSGAAVSVQNKLGELDAEKNKLSKVYTDSHPDIVKIKEQIAELKLQFRGLPETELQYARLSREVEINDVIYRELKAKFQSARIAEVEKVESVIFINPAIVPGEPISPNKKLNYLLGAMVGLMLGLAGAFLTEQLDTSIGTIEDVESYLSIPVVGIIPYLKTDDDNNKSFIQAIWPKRPLTNKEKISRTKKQLLVHYSSSAPVFEAYRMLRTNIESIVFKEKIQRKIVLISSSGPEEGKSITISNLAIAMAQGGLRTLLIDADMRRASINKIFGMKNEPGLSNVLRGTIDSKDAIKTFTDILTSEIGFDEVLKIPGLDYLNILVSGSLPQSPAELLNSTELDALLAKLRDSYDIILIDSPPVLAVADAVVLGPKADAVIMVYRVGKTARSLLNRAKTQLIETGSLVKGVILNNISAQIEMQYGYYAYYKYYGKYYESDEKSKKRDNREPDEKGKRSDKRPIS
jgi:capsular exopolysaccharide synthesis family protein